MKTIIHGGSDGQCSGDCYDICFFEVIDTPRLHWTEIKKRPNFAVAPHAKDAESEV